ncbi:MAG: type I-E CRISPR-associated protein Cas5/CasD [Anaerolineae bacterium]|nr:type I-E CRISPR-associated protein Cas5/CasD [Anaerolineae bacterium]
MATLLLRLDAPMQAWGTQSHFTHRDTGREPSKSGIVGLLCAALGRPRSEPVNDLAELRMGVRIDQAGSIRRDYHTAGMGGVYKVSGGVKHSLIPSDRYYLADAKFLVGLDGDAALLETLQTALQSPAWFLFLGRKAFVPAERIWLRDGLQDVDLLTALSRYPWLGRGEAPEQLRIVVDDPNGTIIRSDYPLSFEPRRFLPRQMSSQYIQTPLSNSEKED